ncbi:MAG TPA: BatA domain-containing protein, partial [Gemmatimonadaceae bacterium]|nr:BatA domain-containing protein [Gemmatimonadaceae bacterium]
MNLLAPWFLAGLGAIAVPILVHLIHKERKDVQFFPSLMFLHRIPYQAVRRQKIRHWLLFLMRCAAVALLALAFARPFLTGRAAAAGLSGGGARDVVLLLDRSYSMGYDTRWARALDSARAVVASLG